jgi:hypothetical protein
MTATRTITSRDDVVQVSTTTQRSHGATGKMVQQSSSSLRKRSVPYPNSVLDTPNFIAALEDAGLYGTKILPVHIVSFYQALHRQHYPDLSTFVKTYYTNEHNAIQQNHTNYTNHHQPLIRTSDVIQLAQLSDVAVSTAAATTHQQPLKNSVSTKKNRNRMQLPRALLNFLNSTQDFVTVTSTVAQPRTSSDGTTTKLVIQLHDGQYIESVLMRYIRPEKLEPKSATGYGNGRVSLCVSSQCGCAMGCTVTYGTSFRFEC